MKMDKKIKKILNLDKKIGDFPELSSVEKGMLESEQRFEATYHSNRLEGNKLTKDEARKTVLSD